MSNKPADNDDLLNKVRDQVQAALAQPVSQGAPPPADPLDAQVASSEMAITSVRALGNVEDLPPPTKDESVEEARKILRWLRNMEFADRDVEQWLDGSSPKVVTAKKQALQKLVQILVVQIHQARRRNQELKEDINIDNAADALAAIALTMAEHTFNLLPDNYARLSELEAMIDDMPERALMRQSQSLAHLLDTLELGLERATGQEVSELSAASRLMVISNQIEKTAFELHGTDPLAPPEREESIDLARDVIIKLKRAYGGMTLTEMIDQGTPDQKAAFAQAIGEMTEIYRNMMAEAIELNPDLADDPKFKAGNAAIGNYAHSVKLMAAMEIPSHAAATQQISAQAAHHPEQWGDLHDKAVERLIKNAEEVLEKAMEDLAEDQEQQQENETAREAMENAMQHDTAGHGKRKKKRRGETKSRSGKGGKKQRKQNMDMTADDYVLKQGRFAVDAQTARTGQDVPITASVPVPALNAADLQAIRALGGSLRDIGNQLKDIATTVSNVSVNDKILPSPNEQSVAQRILETEQQKQLTNPRGNNGPRV